MHPPRDRSPEDFRRRVTLETPEHVQLALEVAGLGSRALAVLLDTLVLVALFLLLSAASALFRSVGDALENWGSAAVVLISGALFWGYFTLSEGLFAGRTLGKQLVGIRVIMDSGGPLTFGAAVVRNLVRLVDIQPVGSGLIGLLFVFFHPRAKRLGDIAAGTIVVHGLAQETAFLDAGGETPEEALVTADVRLDETEFRLLERFLERVGKLQPEHRRRIRHDLLSRFATRFPGADSSRDAFLRAVYERELAARHSPGAARRSGGGGVRATGTGERFAALNRESWRRFRGQIDRIERRGLRSLPGQEVLAFASGYRAVAADLARARTYGVDPATVEGLERLVAAGHNVLYGLRGVRRMPFIRLLLREWPAAVYRQRRPILLAATLFAIPALAGWLLIRESPALAYRVLPPTMIQRAEQGAAQDQLGTGYGETPDPYLPVVASSIVANNVQVAFLAFAMGVTAALGTVAVLVFNGLFFGAVFGLFGNFRVLGWLLTFVAGHGVLELFAIFIAGAGGLMIGRAIIAPGDLARRDAVVVAGREALKLLGASVCLLLLAGAIEGFLSASGASPALKVGVSAATALLIVLYVEAGRRFARRDEQRQESSSTMVQHSDVASS